MKLDIKLVLTLLVFASTLGGFYYTTEMRLESLEEAVSSLKQENSKLKKLINRKSKRGKPGAN